MLCAKDTTSATQKSARVSIANAKRERADDGDGDSAQSQSFKRTRLGSTANVIGVEAIIRATTRKTAAWQGDDAIV